MYRAVGSFVGTANNYLCQEVYVLAQLHSNKYRIQNRGITFLSCFYSLAQYIYGSLGLFIYFLL